MLLADLGAEVIKIEEPAQGDYIRWLPPYIGKESMQFLLLNRNKKSIKLDLKKEKGRDLFLKLVEGADVVVDSFRPGVMDKLGAGYGVASERNPKVIYCAITGYGQDGPYRDRAGHDINYIGYAGVLDVTGRLGEKPLMPGVQVADITAALMGAIGILAALAARERTGRGQFVDVAMMDASMALLPLMASSWLAGGAAISRGESTLNGGQACYDTYETKDGRYLCIGAIEPKFWKKFCALVERPDLEIFHFSEGKDRDRLRAALEEMFRTRDRDAWLRLLEGADVCVGPVHSIPEAFADPQAAARNMLMELQHPVVGAVKQIGFPIKFSHTPCAVFSPPPAFGEHTDEVLRAAGVSENDIQELRKDNVI